MSEPIVINIGALPNDGTGDPLRTAFNDVNLNFANVFNAGPVLSNVQIANNTILTTNTNGNLILNPNGIGVIQANAHVLPDQTRIRNLGSSSQKWLNIYAQYLNVDNINGSFSNLTVGVANLHINGGSNGYVLQTDGTGNLTWTAQTGGSGNTNPGGSNTQVQFNDAGAFGGQSGFTFNKTTNLLSVPGNIVANSISGGGSGTYGQVAFPLVSNGALDIVNNVGNITLITNSTSYNQWDFGTDGNLTVPGNIGIGNAIYSTGLNAVTIIDNLKILGTTNTVGLYLSSGGNLINAGSNVVDLNSIGNVQISSGVNSWTFTTNGNLILPSNTSAINYANGQPYSTGGGGNYGNSNVVALLANLGSNNISTTGTISAPNGNQSVLFNDNGVIGADAGFNYDKTSNTLYVQTGSFPGQSPLGINAFYAGAESFTILGSDVMAQFTGNVPNYSQINFQNSSNSNIASGDYIITADNGNDTTHFLDLGITSSTWDGTQENSLSNLLGPNNGYLYVQDGNLTLGTKTGTDANVWTFSTDGKLSFPTNSLTIGNDPMGAPIIQAAANVNLQVVASGEEGVADLVWYDNATAPSRVAAVVVNNPFYGGNADVGIVTGNILGSGNNTYIWNFGADGTLSLPSQGNIVGLTPDNSGRMQWVGNSSGDGSGYTTLQLIPDETLVSGDQYLIIDPTGGGHIHIRAGGTQNASYGQLYLGGEQNFVRVIDNQGLTLQNQLVTQNTTTYSDPADFTGATWFSDGGSYYIRYTSTNAQLNVAPYQDINNIYVTWNTGADSATLTYAGAAQNLGDGVYKVSVTEAPPADPTALETIAYTLNITTTNTVTLDSDGFNVGSQNDVTLIGNGYVEITNTSNTEGVLIRTDGLGNAHNWLFGVDGTLTFPQIFTGPGPSEQLTIRGTRQTVGTIGNWSATLSGSTPTLVYTCSSNTILSAKVTFVVESNNATFGWEQFDVAVIQLQAGGVGVTISNRMNNNPANGDTQVTADINGDGAIEVYLAQPGSGTAYVNYTATEFNIMSD